MDVSRWMKKGKVPLMLCSPGSMAHLTCTAFVALAGSSKRYREDRRRRREVRSLHLKELKAAFLKTGGKDWNRRRGRL